MKLSDFNKVFRYHADTVDSWRNLTKTKEPFGDCDDYAWTVACITEPNFFKRWVKIFIGDIRFIRVYTSWGEKHLVLYVEKKGYIDNINKYWMEGQPYERRGAASFLRIVLKTTIGLFK